MRITVMGTGYVGQVTGACLALPSDNHVTCYDIDPSKIRKLRDGQPTIFEPGLADLLDSGSRSRRLRFESDEAKCLPQAEVIFIAVGTPSRPNGQPDLSQVWSAVQQIIRHVRRRAVVVVKSTVPPGTCAAIERRFARSRCKGLVTVVSNPEFLREGTAIDDFQRPDRVVIGANDEEAARKVHDLYKPFIRGQNVFVMSREGAEIVKYAANSYLAMRISFANLVALLCSKAGAEVDDVIAAVGADARIGTKFFYPGLGYGGSCFPKDVQGMARVLASHGATNALIRAVHEINEGQPAWMLRMMQGVFGRDWRGRTFAVWGCSFKPKTDDIREAPALRIIDGVLERGGRVQVYDPRAIEKVRVHYRRRGRRVLCCRGQYAALTGADALVICTEWHEFRWPDFRRVRRALKRAILFDGRNVFTRKRMMLEGFEYYSIGRPPITAADLRPEK